MSKLTCQLTLSLRHVDFGILRSKAGLENSSCVERIGGGQDAHFYKASRCGHIYLAYVSLATAVSLHRKHDKGQFALQMLPLSVGIISLRRQMTCHAFGMATVLSSKVLQLMIRTRNVFKLSPTTSTKGLQSYSIRMVGHLNNRGMAPCNREVAPRGATRDVTINSVSQTKCVHLSRALHER